VKCPACDFKKNKIVYTERWDTFDTRCHKCLRCGYKFQSVSMPVSMEALLQSASMASKGHFDRDAKRSHDVNGGLNVNG
jgi:Zn ribbon nucleic-acid-binding protein